MKQWANVIFCLVVSTGIEQSQSAIFDFGGGGCPTDGSIEQEMDVVNGDFQAAMQSMLISIAIEFVMIEVFELKEWIDEWKASRKAKKVHTETEKHTVIVK